MSNPFLAEIRTIGFNFAPKGWAMCDGQLMPISQNTALFSLLGTTYGGNGTTTFALPNLNGAFVLGAGQGPGLTLRDLGEVGGEQAVTLIGSEMPAHAHGAVASAALATTGQATNGVWAEPRYGRVGQPAYAPGPASGSMSPGATSITGGNQPHNNMPPFLGMYFVIALQGVFPARS